MAANAAMKKSDCPETPQELITWFANRVNPRHLRLMIKNAQLHDMEISHLWNMMIERDLLDKGARCGWIDRSGVVYPCGYAAHDQLLYLMGMDVGVIEEKGWVRFHNMHGGEYECLKRLSAAQLSRLREIGIPIKEKDED